MGNCNSVKNNNDFKRIGQKKEEEDTSIINLNNAILVSEHKAMKIKKMI